MKHFIKSINGIDILRISIAVLVGIHGWARYLSDAIVPFGDFLDAVGFPLGLWIASGITILEILGSISYIMGRLILPLSLIYSFIYSMGIILVHFEEGWFVVGLGRNGMEYSVLLIICFLVVGLNTVQEQLNNKP